MKKLNIYIYLLVASALLLAVNIVFIIAGRIESAGPFFIAFFLMLAAAFRGYQALKGLSYTVIIFTAVTASLFYPGLFTNIGTFQLKTLIVPLLQIIMFGMGSQMSLKDFAGVIKMPKGVLLGVGSHYIIMPLVGFGIAHIFHFPAEIKAGIILIGCVPSGLASNVMSYIAGANLALAVTVGAISTLLSPLVTPFLMKILGGQFIEVNFWKMMFDILNMIILPIIAGFTFNMFMYGNTRNRKSLIEVSSFILILILTNFVYLKSGSSSILQFFASLLRSIGWFLVLPAAGAILLKYIIRDKEKWMGKILSFLSMAGIALIITIITASGRESLLKVGALLILTSLLHNVAGYILGYSAAYLVRLPEKDRRTIAFEVGMQNGGLASGLAQEMGKIATVGLAPAIFGPLMNVTGSALASWWRGKPPRETDKTIKP